jgi:hypothetical protein
LQPYFLILQDVTVYFQYITEQNRELLEGARRPLETSSYTEGAIVSLPKVVVLGGGEMYVKETLLFSTRYRSFNISF